MKKIKLEHFIASQTALSRRKIMTYLKEGAISINQKVATSLTEPIHTVKDHITINGEPILKRTSLLYYKCYKPNGMITTLDDPKGRLNISAITNTLSETLVPVGRLDRQTSGLIFLTNDGQFTYHITHPKSNITKTYQVSVEKPISKSDFKRLSTGFFLEDGPVIFSSITPLDKRRIQLSLTEGRNRIVRRALEFLGYKVLKLKRVAIGVVSIETMKEGETKKMTKHEIQSLGYKF